MANREALRELQVRLTRRLQAARVDDLTVSWLALQAGGTRYLFPLAQSGEVAPLPVLQVVPHVKPWFLGVANLRGALYGVIDLASFIGCDEAARPSLSEAHVITFNPGLALNCALQVDTLVGLRRRDAFAHSYAPAAGAPPYFGHCLTDLNGVTWQEVKLASLAQQPEFLSIGVAS
jgi:twitching motility protein PilI